MVGEEYSKHKVGVWVYWRVRVGMGHGTEYLKQDIGAGEKKIYNVYLLVVCEASEWEAGEEKL